jgi:phage/plasmid-associated DNA primase
LFYNDQYYEINAEALIRRNARSVVAKPKTTDISEVFKYIEDTCEIITWKDIEHSIHLKCLLNGIYNIKTGIFSSKFNPDFIILNQIPHNYNELAVFEKIDAKVKTLIPNDNSRQSYYDFLSTCLHPYTGVDFQFGCIGRTGTGKSQLGFLAEFVLGENNVKDATIHLLAKDQTTQKNVAFKMLNIDNDLSNESIQQIDVIKKWITQDKFTARGIYEQSSDFRPMSRLMFMANDLYEIANPDDADAIYDRTYIIRVDKKFRHEEYEIKNLMKKVAVEDQLEGFITYLLKNASWIYISESYHHKLPVSEVESIWNTFGNRIRMFANKWIEKGPSYRTEQSEPFNKWMSYCIHHDFKARTKKHFSDIFEEIIGNTPTKTRIDGNECYAYSGFRIRTDEEVASEETIPFNSGKNDVVFKQALKALSISLNLIISEKKNTNVKKDLELRAFRAFESDDD